MNNIADRTNLACPVVKCVWCRPLFNWVLFSFGQGSTPQLDPAFIAYRLSIRCGSPLTCFRSPTQVALASSGFVCGWVSATHLVSDSGSWSGWHYPGKCQVLVRQIAVMGVGEWRDLRWNVEGMSDAFIIVTIGWPCVSAVSWQLKIIGETSAIPTRIRKTWEDVSRESVRISYFATSLMEMRYQSNMLARSLVGLLQCNNKVWPWEERPGRFSDPQYHNIVAHCRLDHGFVGQTFTAA